MCSPTIVISLASNVLKFQQQRKTNRAIREQAIKQREIAEKNYRFKVAQEQLKIRQKEKQAREKAYAVDIESREKRAEARVSAETFGGGVLDRIVNDYFRQEGNYKSSVLRNLELEMAQSDQNIKGYELEKEGNTPYIPPVNTLGLFGASALSFAGSYYNWKADQVKTDALKSRTLQAVKLGKNIGKINEIYRH